MWFKSIFKAMRWNVSIILGTSKAQVSLHCVHLVLIRILLLFACQHWDLIPLLWQTDGRKGGILCKHNGGSRAPELRFQSGLDYLSRWQRWPSSSGFFCLALTQTISSILSTDMLGLGHLVTEGVMGLSMLHLFP